MNMNVLVLETYAQDYARALLAAHPDISVHAAPTFEDAGIGWEEVDVLIAFGIAVDNTMVARASRLKWIQSLATGVDHFLKCPALRPDTILTSGRGIHGPAMRESVAYLMLALTHDAPRLAKSQADRVWDRNAPWPLLSGKTAVLLGTGVSGSATAALLKAFGMTVIGVTRTPREIENFDRVMSTDNLTEAAAEADYLVNILPANGENTHIIGAQVFAAMKPDARFINVGRGETVDETALIDTLKHQRIGGAGLDVFAIEPLPAESPLWNLPNVVITPHIGGFFSEYTDAVLPIVLENMDHFLAGRTGEMRNVIPH